MFNPGSTSPSLLEGYTATSRYWSFTIFGCAFQHIREFHCYPISLAATDGVAFCFPFLWVLRCFSSPGSLRIPMHSVYDTLSGGFPHSDIYRSQPGYRLPIAFRRFQRPSSPLDAKSSTVCPYWFDQSDLMPTHLNKQKTVSTRTSRMTSPACRQGLSTRLNHPVKESDSYKHHFRRILRISQLVYLPNSA